MLIIGLENTRSAPVAAAKKRGQRGKGIAAAASASFSSHKIFRTENKTQKEDTLGPTHPSARVKKVLPKNERQKRLKL